MRGPSAMTSSKKRGKYPYWVNTQFTCVPEGSGPARRSAPARISTSSHYSNLAFPCHIHLQILLGKQHRKQNPASFISSDRLPSMDLLNRSSHGRFSAPL